MSYKLKKLSLLLGKLGLPREADEAIVLLSSDEEELPKRFPLAFRYWIRDVYYKSSVDQTYSPKWKGIAANSLFKKEPNSTRSKIYAAWKLIIDARDDREEAPVRPPIFREEERPVRDDEKAVQLDLFGGLRPNTHRVIEKLSFWLDENEYREESRSVSGLMKMAAGRPMPINKAELESIADELLAEVEGKLRDMEGADLQEGSGRTLSPSDLQEYVLSSASNLFGETKLSDYLNTSVTKEKKNIRGDSISVTYSLMFKDPDGRDSKGSYQEDTSDPGKKRMSVFYSANSAMQNAILKYHEKNGNPEGSFEDEIKAFKESLKPYIVNTLVHEEVHALDIISKVKRSYEKYKVSNPEGEALDQIANRLEVTGDNLLIENYNRIIDEVAPFIELADRNRAITDLSPEAEQEFEAIYDQVRTELLPQGFEIEVPQRAQSQIRINKVPSKDVARGDYRTKSLAEIAKHTGVKGGVKRLLIVNFKNLFGDEGWPQSYQQIYDLFWDPSGSQKAATKNTYLDLIHSEILEGEEIKLTPSYTELYMFDKGFYVSTNEEFKAIMTEVMHELSTKFEQNEALDISAARPEELVELSMTAKDLRRELQARPVDEFIKTPLGFLDKLKENRVKMFYSGMNHIYYMLKDKLAESEPVED
jgi:hypothetical protein